MAHQTTSYPPPAVSVSPLSSSSQNPLIQPSMASPTSPTSPSATSSAHRSFFGAITERVRGRSRSRSPQPPRTQMSPPSSAATLQRPKRRSAPRPVKDRTASSSTTATTDSSKTDRSSISSTDRSPWDTMTYGRHSSEWIFKSQRTLKRQSTASSTSS